MIQFNSISRKKIIKEILHQEGCPSSYNKYAESIPQNIPLEAFADHNSQSTLLPGVGGKNPEEIISSVNKAALRKAVIKTIKEKLFSENLPYIHLAYYPNGFRTVVTLRIDCDETNQIDFDRVLYYADLNSIPLTWFIDMKYLQSYLPYIASIRERGHDIQLHCYEHETYETYRQNKKNIYQGKKLMEGNGIIVKGFASPFGKWNPSLNRALEKLNFTFSSEFALAYDDLPFYPIIGNRFSKILQIPIHPVCIGLLRNAGFSRDEMKTYFESIIREKFKQKDPIMLYGHPYKEIDQYPEVFDFILSYLKRFPDVWITTYREFAFWWKKRLCADFSIQIENDKAHIKTDNSNQSLLLRLEMPDGSETFLPLKNGSTLLTNLI